MSQSDIIPAYFELVGNQRAQRELKTDPVPQDLIEKILEAGTHAPSANNCQPWHFVVVQDSDLRQEIADGAQAAWEGFARDMSGDQTTVGFKAIRTNHPPPFSPVMYGNFQMLPKPTADPAAARMNPKRLPQCMLVSG